MQVACGSKLNSADTSIMILLDSDVLIGQTALSLGLPLHSFNQRYYSFIPGAQTIQPYTRTSATS